MTTKVFCDGCDAEIPDADSRNQTEIQVRVADEKTHRIVDSVDLCKRCLSVLISNIDPRKWARVEEGRSTYRKD